MQEEEIRMLQAQAVEMDGMEDGAGKVVEEDFGMDEDDEVAIMELDV